MATPKAGEPGYQPKKVFGNPNRNYIDPGPEAATFNDESMQVATSPKSDFSASGEESLRTGDPRQWKPDYIEDFAHKYADPGQSMEVSYNLYQDGVTPYIELNDADTGEPYCTASVCVPGETPRPGHTFIKDWSENEGIYDELVRAGIIGKKVRSISSGYVEAYECPILEQS